MAGPRSVLLIPMIVMLAFLACVGRTQLTVEMDPDSFLPSVTSQVTIQCLVTSSEESESASSVIKLELKKTAVTQESASKDEDDDDQEEEEEDKKEDIDDEKQEDNNANKHEDKDSDADKTSDNNAEKDKNKNSNSDADEDSEKEDKNTDKDADKDADKDSKDENTDNNSKKKEDSEREKREKSPEEKSYILATLSVRDPAHLVVENEDGRLAVNGSLAKSLASLILTISQPRAEDSGIYTCLASTLNSDFEIEQLKAIANLTTIATEDSSMLVLAKTQTLEGQQKHLEEDVTLLQNQVHDLKGLNDNLTQRMFVLEARNRNLTFLVEHLLELGLANLPRNSNNQEHSSSSSSSSSSSTIPTPTDSIAEVSGESSKDETQLDSLLDIKQHLNMTMIKVGTFQNYFVPQFSARLAQLESNVSEVFNKLDDLEILMEKVDTKNGGKDSENQDKDNGNNEETKNLQDGDESENKEQESENETKDSENETKGSGNGENNSEEDDIKSKNKNAELVRELAEKLDMFEETTLKEISERMDRMEEEEMEDLRDRVQKMENQALIKLPEKLQGVDNLIADNQQRLVQVEEDVKDLQDEMNKVIKENTGDRQKDTDVDEEEEVSLSTKACYVCGDEENQEPCTTSDLKAGLYQLCPLKQDVCMNIIVQDERSRSIYKRCASEAMCQELASDPSPMCTSFSFMSRGTFTCHFCCTSHKCNRDFKPVIDVYHG